MRASARVVGLALTSLVGASAACGETLVGLTTSNGLVRFDSATPGTVVGPVPISGLAPGDSVVGIDARPATGLLYGLGVNAAIAHLYTIDASTGLATQLGGNVALPQSAGVAAAGVAFGFDFNPVADRIRVVADTQDNFRLNPDSGSVAGADAALNPGAPVVVGAAYTNNLAGAVSTTLYAVDTSSNPDQLVIIGGNPVPPGPSPNGGTLTVVGSLGVETSSNALGFDVSPTGTAFASLTVAGVASLNVINLATGAATLVGPIGAPFSIRDIAVVIPPPASLPAEAMIGLTTTNSLVFFNSASPAVVTGPLAITGLVAGDSVVGIDERPAFGTLFGLGVNGAVAHLYSIDPTTGAAAQVGGNVTLPQSAGVAGSDTDFGVDFNPVADRLRVTANNGDNFRMDPNTGSVAGADAALNPGAPVVVGAAYANNVPGAASTTLYAVDTSTSPDRLVLIGGNPVPPGPSPNGGTLTLVGPLPLDTSNNDLGLDISPAGNAWASLTVGGTARFYAVNLVGGAATLVGPVGQTLAIRDVAVDLPIVPVELLELNVE